MRANLRSERPTSSPHTSKTANSKRAQMKRIWHLAADTSTYSVLIAIVGTYILIISRGRVSSAAAHARWCTRGKLSFLFGFFYLFFFLFYLFYERENAFYVTFCLSLFSQFSRQYLRSIWLRSSEFCPPLSKLSHKCKYKMSCHTEYYTVYTRFGWITLAYIAVYSQ